jgi:hypothetical protein
MNFIGTFAAGRSGKSASKEIGKRTSSRQAARNQHQSQLPRIGDLLYAASGEELDPRRCNRTTPSIGGRCIPVKCALAVRIPENVGMMVDQQKKCRTKTWNKAIQPP